MTELDTSILVIGEEPQFFFDLGIVETVQNLKRTMHAPIKVDVNPVLKSDRPWEHVTYFTVNGWQIWRAPSSGRIHCLYTDWKIDRERIARLGGGIVDWENARLRQLYAHTDDGVTWTKPPMGIQREAGHDTNIVFGTEDFGSVYDFWMLEDPRETDPARRFKALHTYIPKVTPPAGSGDNVRIAFSPDGVHWTPHREDPVFGKLGGRLGDQLMGAFDPETRTYLVFNRHPLMHGAPPRGRASTARMGGTPTFDRVAGQPIRRNRRRVFMSESSDFVHWNEPRLVLAPDPELDSPDDTFYGLMPLRRDGQWVGFLSVFHMVDNTINVELVHSRDGRAWRRIAPRQPWLDLGPPGAWDQYMVNISSPPVQVGDELWVFFGGAKNHHDWWFAGQTENRDRPQLWRQAPEVFDWNHVGYHLGLAKIRVDGFVSLGANRVREGVLGTQPFIATGDRLLINAKCGPDGAVQVEAMDAAEDPLPGRTRSDCDVFTGDAVRHVVTWRGDPTLPLPATPPVFGGAPYRRLRFFLRDAELYSFRVVRSQP